MAEPGEKEGRHEAFDICSGVSCTGEGLVGSKTYDYNFLCMPQLPGKKQNPPMFLGKDAKLPLLVSVIMGLQHCLAMLGGIVTPPTLIANDTCRMGDLGKGLCDSKQYLISASLITSGILTIIQVVRFRIFGKYYIGTGLISVMGTSFTFLPIAREVVTSQIAEGTDGKDAYGKFLGTCIVASLLEVALSFIPPKFMRKIFTPVVTGTCVILIGAGLTSAGIKYWGGGVFCAENDLSASFGPILCSGNGEVVLGYGAPEYVGLGFSVIFFLIFIEIVGSPFMKNSSVILALFFGYFVAGVSSYDKDGKSLDYVTSTKIDDADAFTFLWVKTFKLGFHAPAFLPILIGFIISTIETAGDIKASCDVSEIPSEGEDADSRVQGGLLADGINSFIAGFMTTPPNTTFSQNNGVIALTRCASRAAGISCAIWLILFGVLGKFAGVIASIPDCVLGGMTIFLFANVMVSGMAIIAKEPMTRRNRFILAIALGVGIGVTCEPHFAEGGGLAGFNGANRKHNMGLWPGKEYCNTFPMMSKTITPESCLVNGASHSLGGDMCTALGGVYTAAVTEMVENKSGGCLDYDDGIKAWRDTVVLIIKTPYCIGTLLALILNLILPHDKTDEELEAEGKGAMIASAGGK
mmetsp:Transcript_54216/g.172087  ORF Transcript_54216/g.172087 Transcript_54216/m.172087 type:complete len:636 (+) Transcript_54216:123-2030(+)|eukprot:CAMPEP_0182874706 /NCGR_PEP_ID=MMETSP0034_2-20130328/13096_1 /TAXON_ID=156128 /ORGANISM="Nephroselmis pyriformis, Strain CCMP717" /LENGTH=635 /DNA_ID=CAMNT_0025007429 /DNA_START=16 /DNA_END=1923 /DNA_ORIENTATION=+